MEVLDGITWAASHFYASLFQRDVVKYILMLAVIVLLFNIIVEVFYDNDK